MKRLRLILILVAVLVVGWLVVRLARSKEPSYQGKTVREWFKTGPSGGTAVGYTHEEVFKFREAMNRLGTNAFPFLLYCIRYKDPAWASKMDNILVKTFHVTPRFVNADAYNIMVMKGADGIGTNALSILPELRQLSTDPDSAIRSRAYLFMSLAFPKDKVLQPILKNGLNDSDPSIARFIGELLKMEYPDEAEKLGVYEKYPYLKPGGKRKSTSALALP